MNDGVTAAVALGAEMSGEAGGAPRLLGFLELSLESWQGVTRGKFR